MKKYRALKRIEKVLSITDEVSLILAEKLDNGNYSICYFHHGKSICKDISQEDYEKLESHIILDDVREDGPI